MKRMSGIVLVCLWFLEVFYYLFFGTGGDNAETRYDRQSNERLGQGLGVFSKLVEERQRER